MGRTALALARLLVREGAAPFISELKGAAACGEIPAALDGLGVAWECGGHTERALAGSALVVPSPGVPPASPLLQDARAAGISVTGEMELAWRFTNARILAVTGTNGKTTTTAMTVQVLRAGGIDCGYIVGADVPAYGSAAAGSAYELSRQMRTATTSADMTPAMKL